MSEVIIGGTTGIWCPPSIRWLVVLKQEANKKQAVGDGYLTWHFEPFERWTWIVNNIDCWAMGILHRVVTLGIYKYSNIGIQSERVPLLIIWIATGCSISSSWACNDQVWTSSLVFLQQQTMPNAGTFCLYNMWSKLIMSYYSLYIYMYAL